MSHSNDRAAKLRAAIEVLEETVTPPIATMESLIDEMRRQELARQIGRFSVLTELKAELQQLIDEENRE